jgi:hypothetical protein
VDERRFAAEGTEKKGNADESRSDGMNADEIIASRRRSSAFICGFVFFFFDLPASMRAAVVDVAPVGPQALGRSPTGDAISRFAVKVC